MRLFTFSLFIIVVISMLGCSAENPICSTNFCAVGEVFPRSELEDGQAFSEVDIDDTVIFATLAGGDTPVQTTPVATTLPPDDVAPGEHTFEPVEVTGIIDWDFRDTDWQYRENSVTYLKKVTLEIEADEGRFGENRVLLIHLNKDTVTRDENFTEHVDFLGTETIKLTHHIGIATFKGDIVGAPTKP